MNLIEQLGRYEKAKAFLNATSFTIDELIMMQRSGLRTQHVEKALLEYRRQHNIFEVGDKVVLKNNEQEGVLTVQMFKDDFIRAYLDDFKYSFGHQINFRHATDAEIAVGRRL